MKTILAVGLNPALQKTLVFDSVNAGGVNRAVEEYVSPGGKSVHFARAAQTVFPGSVIPAYFAGGPSGKKIVQMLATLGIESLVVEVDAETRTCSTVIDRSSQQVTELVGVSRPVNDGEVDRMKALLLETIPSMDGLAFCGTYPDGVDEGLFLDLLACHGGKPVLVDAYRGVDRVLESGHVTFLKVNIDEARELTGVQAVSEIGRACFDNFGLEALMITDGPRPAYLLTPEKQRQFDLECISFVNPIGAGDTCAGVMFSAYLNGDEIELAFSKGLAAASTSCMHYEGAVFSLEEMGEQAVGITITDYEGT